MNLNPKQKQFLVFLPLMILISFGFWWLLAIQDDEKEVRSDLTAPPSSNIVQANNIGEKTTVSQQEVDQSKRQAEAFLQSYLAYDGDKPDQHIQNSKTWMTKNLYDQLIQEVTRPTQEMQFKKLVSVENSQHVVLDEQMIEWSFTVIEEVTDRQGKKRNEEWTYILTTLKQDGWKVGEVEVRGVLE